MKVELLSNPHELDD